jgi:hypothetical protein
MRMQSNKQVHRSSYTMTNSLEDFQRRYLVEGEYAVRPHVRLGISRHLLGGERGTVGVLGQSQHPFPETEGSMARNPSTAIYTVSTITSIMST